MHLGFQFFRYKIGGYVIDLQELNTTIKKLETRRMFAELGIDDIQADGYEMVKEVE